MSNTTAHDPHRYAKAEDLVRQWEASNAQLETDLRAHITESVRLYIKREEAQSQAPYMKGHEELTNALAAIRAMKKMPVYAAITEEWSRQNPTQSSYPQEALAWNLALARG